jgi:S-disulfanyl-L-cysteine oxidoreductase SoxD
MRRFATLSILSTALIAPLTFGGQQAPSAERSVMSGVYSADQAARGRTSHRTNCTSCHGTTNYTGEAFEKLWLGSTLFDVLDRLRTTMPEDNPGNIPVTEYVDIIAYILSVNGYPQGTAELLPDEAELRKVKVDSAPPRK